MTPTADAGAVFPLAYYVGFLRFLKRHPRIEVITYADLDWCDDFDFERNYPDERARWLADHAGDDRVYVLLQHDVDARPDRTMRVLAEEEALGLTSTTLVFNRTHDRQLLARERRLKFVPYDLDVPELQRLERESGFCIGYHLNAYEQALWDMEEAVRRFRTDVMALRELFDIRFFSPHGGVPAEDGTNNNHIRVPDDLKHSVRWVANRRSIICDGSYSDGGIMSVTRDLAARDLRDFVRTWRPGCRYRVLTHPQYYACAPRAVPRLLETEWYRRVMEDSDATADALWDGVELERLGSAAQPSLGREHTS